MKFLITADWQADWSNLDTCRQAWDQVCTIALKERVDVIVVAGDLKSTYNPVDVWVTRWWMDATKRVVNNGIELIYSLGNHDRIGQYNDKENWFPILRRAGATCVDRPQMLCAGELAILPYCTDKEQLKINAKWLADRSDPERTILIFHEDLLWCKYNKLGMRSENGIDAKELCPHRYLYCFGGHIHLRQKIGDNIWYVGSPFCQDWGEANQRKGFTVVAGNSPVFHASTIPGWFDPTWPGFYEPESWKGCSVRVHARCKSAIDFLETTETARIDAETRYEGAEIYVTATFERDRVLGESVEFGAVTPDELKIREYVKKTCPEQLNQKEVVEYLMTRVRGVRGSIRSGAGVRFVEARGKNFLSFKKLQVKWNARGITLVQGRNRDRKGRSNGAGKTAMLQTIPVGLFGLTFKGQKHDKWARRNAQREATVNLVIRDPKGRRIEILRQRKPTRLQLWIDQKDVTTGLNPNDKNATQGEIETVTGFTWQTLANAVYIDQEVARSFLAGTKKERTAVLAKFQNLERFQKALDLVRRDYSNESDSQRERQGRLAVIEEKIKGLKKQISILSEESQQRVEQGWKELQKAKKAYIRTKNDIRPKLSQLQVKVDRIVERAEAALDHCEKQEWALAQWQEKLDRAKNDMEELSAAQMMSVCPKCHQKVDRESIKAMLKQAEKDVDQLNDTMVFCRKRVTDARLDYQLKEGESDKLQGRVVALERELANSKLNYTHVEKHYHEMRRREHMETDVRLEAKQSLGKAITRKQTLEKEIRDSLKQQEFYQYCERAVSRDGIPAFLNALLCPQLNVAAEYYAELFADNAIQVRFEIENGEFVPVVLNATGGEDIDAQSDGERALAGLIASFALREIAPRCNVLILDEPGNGLDPSSARQFAKALRELKKKFESIFVTSHNVHILQELDGERVVTVEKRNGVSQLLEA